MKRWHQGLVLMIISFAIWSLSLSLLFDYIVNVLYPSQGFGEPIWVIDPIGFWMISIPTGLVFLMGLLSVLSDTMKKNLSTHA